MEDGGEDMELKYELWKESIFQEKVICECRKRLSGYRRAVFCFIVELNIKTYFLCNIKIKKAITVHKSLKIY